MEIFEFTCFVDFVQFKKNDDNSIKKILKNKIIIRSSAVLQNKMHFSVHGQTAAEVIYNRANVDKESMGFTNCLG